MLHFGHRELKGLFDPERIYYGEGRGEFGVCLHLPLSGYIAGSAPAEDYQLMIAVANDMIEFLRYKRLIKGPEMWDYDPEKATEAFTVCGDNPSTSGIILRDSAYSSGPKLQLFLDKTFGANEVSVRWKNNLVGDERLLDDYEEYMRETLRDGTGDGQPPESGGADYSGQYQAEDSPYG